MIRIRRKSPLSVIFGAIIVFAGIIIYFYIYETFNIDVLPFLLGVWLSLMVLGILGYAFLIIYNILITVFGKK
jgi:hypothetical protein